MTESVIDLRLMHRGNARLLFFCCLMLWPLPADAQQPVSFRSDVAPILLHNCVACHSAKKAEGGYRLDTFDELVKAGDSGEAPVATGEGETSELLRRLTAADESERMPAESKPMSDEQIKLITAWVNAGTEFDGENSADLLPFVIPPPRHPDPPESYPSAVPITAIAFSPDGKQVLTSGYHEINVWNAEDGALLRRIGDVGERTFAMALDPSGTTLAVACGTPGRAGELRLIDYASGGVKAVTARSTDVLLDVAFRPAPPASEKEPTAQGVQEVAVALADKTILILNIETLEVTHTLASHADWVTAVAWSDDGSRLVSASRDKSAKVFDAETGQLLVSYQGHGAAVRGVSVMPDGKQVISAGSDNKLHRWQIEGAKRVALVNLGGEGYRLTRGKDWLLVPCADRRLLKIDLSKNSIATEFKGHTDWVLSAALSPDQTRVASGAYDGEVRLWNPTDGSLQSSWTAKP